MTYRVICTYHPDVGTFRGKRGAWRVFDCWKRGVDRLDDGSYYPPLVQTFTAGRDGKLLVVSSHKPRQPHSWCNPRKILAEWQEDQRQAREERLAEQLYDEYLTKRELVIADYDGDGLKAKDYML